MTEINHYFAGIVTFNPSIERLRLVVESIRHQVERIVIVDNGSKSTKELFGEYKKEPSITIIRNERNEGIAKALNQICQYALKEGADWVLTLDHDTLCPDNIIDEFNKYTFHDKAGIICPCVYYEGLEKRIDTNGRPYQSIEACMTSGSLTRIKVWEQVEGFNEGYFVDFVDNDFCKKIRLAGYEINRVGNVTMNHQLGEYKRKKIFFFVQKGTCHSPLRCYYMARNNILYIKQYRQSINVLKEYLKLCKVLHECIMFSDNKSEVLSFIYRGIVDAKRNKTGQYEEKR